MSSRWMCWMVAHDPLPPLRGLEISVLALFSERDLQIPPAQSKALFEAALREAGNPGSRVVERRG